MHLCFILSVHILEEAFTCAVQSFLLLELAHNGMEHSVQCVYSTEDPEIVVRCSLVCDLGWFWAKCLILCAGQNILL